jgi:protein-L-isoaspartate O-methyltransferase
MGRPTDHKELLRQEFTKQAAAYAANSTISDPERVARLIRIVDPSPAARVLEVATGPGYVALGFAAVCREVVGVDLTPAPLTIAERHREELGLANVRFQTGDAERLPIADGAFDVVVCRLAFHHLEDPAQALAEMVRVCRPEGRVAVEDLIVSEHRERASFHNRFENLRDPSHTRALSLSGLLWLFTTAGLEVENVRIDTTVQDLERWLANAQTPPEPANEVRALVARDVAEDLSGTRPIVREGRVFFTHRAAIVVGRRLQNI